MPSLWIAISEKLRGGLHAQHAEFERRESTMQQVGRHRVEHRAGGGAHMLDLANHRVRARDDSREDIAVATEELGQGVNDNIGPVLDRLTQERTGERIVDHQRHARCVGDLGNGGNVGHDSAGIGDGLDEDRAGLVINGLGIVRRIVTIDEGNVPAHLLKALRELVDRTAIELARRHQIAARLH